MGTENEQSELLMLPHLGLGDALICNAIFRAYAPRHAQVVILCKPNNLPSVAFMLRDLTNVEVFGVKDDEEAASARDAARKAGFEVFGMGVWGSKPFDENKWDAEFYRQAGIPFQDRWNQFKVARQPSRELEVPNEPFCLVHDDPSRKFGIDPARLPKLPIVRVDPARSGNLFDWWGHIEQATELHVINSSVAILADSLPLIKAKRCVYHNYSRPTVPPKYQIKWEILQ